MLSVGYGNSIMFRELNGQLASFDNTFSYNEEFRNVLSYHDYRAHYFYTDTIKIQVKVSTGDVPTGKAYNCTQGTDAPVVMVPKTSYTDYDFYEFSKTFVVGNVNDIFYFIIQNSGDDDWRSERIKIIASDDEYTLLEWFNLDPTTARSNNNFEMDYSTGITPFMRIICEHKDYEPKSEISVYDNLDEATKIKERVQRTIKLKTDAIPRYLAEKLVIATAHDNFYVNEVSFIREEKAEVSQLESNLTGFSAVLTQQNVIGLNTSDIGFNCDSIVACKITNLEQTGVSANTTFVVPEGYLLSTITAVHNGVGGNTLLEFGRGVGDDDIGVINVSPNGIGEYHKNAKVLTKSLDYATTGDTTLYVDVSGSSPNADIYIILIDNRQ
jgi:hypothetical protein